MGEDTPQQLMYETDSAKVQIGKTVQNLDKCGNIFEGNNKNIILLDNS